jgi:hypothetical protein
MKLALAKKPFGAERFVETMGGACRVTEEQHRRNATFQKPTRDRAKKKPPESLTLNTLQQVDLVEFAGISRNATVVPCGLCETD